MTIKLNTKTYLDYIDKVTKRIEENKEYITDLDSATGDGDHWVNMNMGFQKLASMRGELEDLNLGDLFKKIAMTLMSTIGGSAGVLYGTAYLEASKAIGPVEEMDIDLLQKFIEAQLQGIMKRGKTEAGDKTMVDSIYQANESMKAAMAANKSDEDILRALAQGSLEGAEATKDMKAKRGRAYYQENKGLGHLDPGAVTMSYQLEELVGVILS